MNRISNRPFNNEVQLLGHPLNSQLRKVTKNKGVFLSDELVFKTLCLTINYITAKWTMPIRNWNEAMVHFLIKFDDRIQGNI